MYLQAASGIEALKMQSPVKMQSLASDANKENMNAAYESDEVAVPIKGIPTLDDDLHVKKTEDEEVVSTTKEGALAEPILQENPNRFVLFPIKYHEVCSRRMRLDASSIFIIRTNTDMHH